MSALGHVLMTTDAVGGVWTYSLDLAKALAPHGVRVSLASMGPRPSLSQRADALSIPGVGLYESDYKVEWMDEPWSDVDAAGDWLLDLESRLQPDIVQVNGFAHGALAWRAPCVVVAHSCVVSWWRAVHRCLPPESWSTYRTRVQAGLRGATAVFAVSRSMAQSAEEHYGVPVTFVIPNARNAREYRPGRKEPFVLTSGRIWDAAKNIGVVTAAARAVSWPVYVAGETKSPQGVPTALTHAHALGQLPAHELRRWFARASVYALPALYEPFGLSVLEAALSGCALVLGDIPSLRENWTDAACFVDPHDPGELAARLNELASNTALRLRLGQRARERGLSFSPEGMAASYLAGYKQAVSSEVAVCAS